MEREHFYLTTPIYYVNDKPHIGHAYTTVAADVLARSLRQEGREVFFLTGTDEHGSKVAERAKKAGLKPQEFCDENSKHFRNLFENLNVSNDDFIRTTESRHVKAVERVLNILKQEDQIYIGKYEGLYCTACERFYTEKELVGGKCPLHGTVPERLKEKNYFFRLSKWLPKVRTLIETDAIRIEPVERKNEALGFFKQGLEDFSVSRERVTWGIPLPFDRDQVTYVWVDALINYLSAIGYPDKKYEAWWPADLHLIGRDILKFHAIYWPALLLAVGLKPPKRIFVHGFFTVNGQKMSKSLGNAIDPNVLINEYGVDATRYLLLSQFPFGLDGDLNFTRVRQQYNAELANGLGNLVSRIATLIKQSGGHVVLPSTKEVISQQRQKDVIRELKKLSLAEAQDVARGEVRNLDAELAKKKPWELSASDGERANFLRKMVEELMGIAVALEPFMPDASKKILDHFQAERVTEIPPLFPRRVVK